MTQAAFQPALKRTRLILAGCALVLGAGCATTNGDSRDPLEGFNRSMHRFNDGFDEAIGKPVATAYRDMVPELVRTGVRNFFSNLGDIFIGVNNLLQGKVIDAASDGMRFAVNTVFGGLGVLDWASEMRLEKHNEDFGQTFGRWGVGSGAYIVWPFLGPSTLRDTIGTLIDQRGDPVRNHEPIAARNALILTRLTGQRADLLDASRLLEEAALDKYVFQRDAYLQRRRSLVHDGNPPREPRPEDESPREPRSQVGPAIAGTREPARASGAPPVLNSEAPAQPLPPPGVNETPRGRVALSIEPRIPHNYEAVLSAAAREDPQHAKHD